MAVVVDLQQDMLPFRAIQRSASENNITLTIGKDDHTIDGDEDSGRWSLGTDLPGADLSEREFLEEFSEYPTPESSRIPIDLLHITDILDLEEHNDLFIMNADGMLVPPPSTMPISLTKKQKRKKRRWRQSSPVSDELEENKECSVCLSTIRRQSLLAKPCSCKIDICKTCMSSIVNLNINEGHPYMPCPNPECSKPLKREVIIEYIENNEVLNKYERFRLNFEGDGKKKTCPYCCIITERDLPQFIPKRNGELTPEEYHLTCEACSFEWCFNCHSPWHEDVSCRAYRAGDKQFVKWTRGRNAGYTPNCQTCPKCKVYIERSTGCDSMTCNQCHTNFCYKCGNKFTSFPGLGDHYKKLSVFGCPYNYQQDSPVKRKLIRGGFLFTRAAALTGYPILLIGGCVVIGALVVVGVPIIGGVVAYKVIRRRRRGW